MIRIVVWTFLLLGFSLSCAVPVPPTGGPEDKEQPRITGTSPDSAETGVSVEAPITIHFSEKMSRSRIERLVSTYPPFEIGDVSWSKNSIEITPAKPLVADTTYLVMIKPGFKDSHNVSNTSGFSYAFATAAHIDSGSISGSVLFRRKPTDKAVVRCFVIKSDTIFDPAAARPDRETGTDSDGKYHFAYLPTDSARLLVWAFQDQNGNSYFDRDKEFGESYQDTVTLTAASPLRGAAAITIIDPTEPGEIEGVIANQTGVDTFPVAVALYTRADTVESVAHYLICDAGGNFHIKKVAPGGYMLRSFIDFNPDSACGTYPCLDDSSILCVEPCAEYPDSVRLGPGETMQLDSLVLKPAREVRDDD